jgi:hypothetical protein
MNDIGVRCLPYPRKNSTIRELIAWFETEIKALPQATAKANKNFLVYCIVGVLKMLQGPTQCRQVGGLVPYLVFMPKPCTHRMYDPGSIVQLIRQKVFTDNQMSRIKYNDYISNVSKDYDCSQ